MKRNVLSIVGIVVVAVGLMVVGLQAQQFKDVDVAAAKSLIAKGDVVVLDVRTPEEFRNGHIDNAVLANINDPSFEAKISKLSKTKPVLVYCAKGGRSARASKMMVEKGWKNVSNMAGGFTAWSGAGYPSVKGDK